MKTLWIPAALFICAFIAAGARAQTDVPTQSADTVPITARQFAVATGLLDLASLTSAEALLGPAAAPPITSSYVAPRDETEAPHRFWDTPNKFLLIGHYALEAADFGITHRNLASGGKELSWLAKPLVNQGTAGQVTYFAGRSVAVTAMSYALHKTGHHRLERAFIMLSNADSTSGLSYSLAHR